MKIDSKREIFDVYRGIIGDNVVKISEVYVWKSNSGNRRCFYISVFNGKKVEMKSKLYARYLMEKKYNRILKSEEDAHHKDENTMNDSINNLEILTDSDHNSLTNTGNKYMSGKHHSEESKRKIGKSNRTVWKLRKQNVLQTIATG